MFRSLVSAAFIMSVAFLARAEDRLPVPAVEPMPPLTAVLIANRDAYALEPAYAGKRFRDEVEKARKQGKTLPPAQKVDFVLRITNHMRTPITIAVGGDESRIDLEVGGEGALNLDNPVAMTMDFRMGRPTQIKPGESIDLPIGSLASGIRGVARVSYFTEPGEHTLIATFTTTREGEEGQTVVRTPAVKFKVERAAKAG